MRKRRFRCQPRCLLWLLAFPAAVCLLYLLPHWLLCILIMAMLLFYLCCRGS